MRPFLLALAATLALAACNNDTAQQSRAGIRAGDPPAAFPSTTGIDYRAEAMMIVEGALARVVQSRSGAMTRLEYERDGRRMAQIIDPQANTAYLIIPSDRTALAILPEQTLIDPIEYWRAHSSEARPTETGSCLVAGEAGFEWAIEKEGEPLRVACVTTDGLFLSASENNAAVWEIEKLERGRQPESDFIVPAGYSRITRPIISGGGDEPD